MVWGKEQGHTNIDHGFDKDKLKNVFKHLFREHKEGSLKRTGDEISIKVKVDRLRNLMEAELGRSNRQTRRGEEHAPYKTLEIRWFNRIY